MSVMGVYVSGSQRPGDSMLIIIKYLISSIWWGFTRKSASDAIISVLQEGVKGEDMESVWGRHYRVLFTLAEYTRPDQVILPSFL